jgi:hypothetical protein
MERLTRWDPMNILGYTMADPHGLKVDRKS